MIASISCQQKINRHVDVQIWHGCISPLHVSGFFRRPFGSGLSQSLRDLEKQWCDLRLHSFAEDIWHFIVLEC